MGRPRLQDDPRDAEIYLSQMRSQVEVPQQARMWKGPQSLGGHIAKGILDELLTKPRGTFVTIPRPAAHVTNTIRSSLAKDVRKTCPGWTVSVWQADGDRLTAVMVQDVEYVRDKTFTPRSAL